MHGFDVMPLFPLIDDVPDQWFAESSDKDSGIVSTVNILLAFVVAGELRDASEYSFKQGFSCWPAVSEHAR